MAKECKQIAFYCQCFDGRPEFMADLPAYLSHGGCIVICVITTAPRDGAYYLDQTVSSLRYNASNDVYVFAEPGSRLELPKDSATVLQNETRLGNWGNWRKAAQFAVELAGSRGDRFVVTAEDDVLFHRDATYYANSVLSDLVGKGENVGFFALYTSSIYQRAIPEGVHPYLAKSLWGACALAWPVESLKKVLDHKIAKTWRGMEPVLPPLGHPDICHADTCIGACLIDMKLKMYFSKPAACQHIGAVSSLRKVKLTPERQASHVMEGENV